jgi:hypothetical protein
VSRAAPPTGAARGKARIVRPAKSLLADEESAALRDRLIAELDDLTSTDEAANWVHRRWPTRICSRTPDAKLVESRFKAKPESFAAEEASEPSSEAGQVAPEPDPQSATKTASTPLRRSPEDLSPQRRWGRPFACATWSIADSCPAALRPHAGRPAPSSFCPAPRARTKSATYIHGPRLSHTSSRTASPRRRASWWAAVNVYPVPIALELWRRTRLGRFAESTRATPARPQNDRISLTQN